MSGLGGILGAFMKGSADRYLFEKDREEQRAIEEREKEADRKYQEYLVLLRSKLDAKAERKRQRAMDKRQEAQISQQNLNREDTQQHDIAVLGNRARANEEAQIRSREIGREQDILDIEAGTKADPTKTKSNSNKPEFTNTELAKFRTQVVEELGVAGIDQPTEEQIVAGVQEIQNQIRVLRGDSRQSPAEQSAPPVPDTVEEAIARTPGAPAGAIQDLRNNPALLEQYWALMAKKGLIK